MSEESKPIAPGGASSVCETCGRTKGLALGFCSTGLTYNPDAKLGCATLGYEREHRRAESAERELESCRSRLSTAEKERQDARDAAYDLGVREAIQRSRADEAEAQVEQLVGDVQAVSHDYTDTLNALRRLLVAVTTNPGALETADATNAARAALYGGDTEDAPEAPKASEVPADSSALEKALGALRAIMRLARCDAGHEAAALDQIYEAGWIAISDGAHVDGPVEAT